MDVTLYVYDLSKGLARQYSRAFLGTYIDAVYHTALVFDNVEYFFGRGVQTCLPGATHHGQPMEKILLGKTSLPMDVILEYLDSLKTIYTAESYDLFLHNCNNFSHDFAMFLVGKGIPEHITSLPQTVLNTPFGQMLKPQLDQALRGVTQAEVPQPSPPQMISNDISKPKSLVHIPTSMAALQPLLEKALDSCVVLFFTSQTCPPCKICYEPFERLAEEFKEQATLIKIDISQARDIAVQYSIRATPTFITILQGEKLEQWSGADVVKLQSNTRMLVQMAHPPHPHTQLRLPSLQQVYKAQVYRKMPPLEKVLGKLDASIRNTAEVSALKDFVNARNGSETAANNPVPDLASISHLVQGQIKNQIPLKVFPLVDLIRMALLDVRVSGYFAEEKPANSLTHALITRGAKLEINSASYPFLLTTIQALSNTFTSPLSLQCILSAEDGHKLISNALLAKDHAALRASAANLVFNIASAHHKQVFTAQKEQAKSGMSGSEITDTIVGIIEALNQELDRESQVDKDTVKGLLLSLGLLLYGAPTSTLDELKDILEAVEAKKIINKVKGMDGCVDIIKDVLHILP